MNGWDVRPTLDRASATGRSLAQAAGSLVAGSPLPQALIQCRQRLTNELRLGTLVILSWSAPQPCSRRLGGGPAHDGRFTGLVRVPERTGDTPPRHIPRPTSLRAHHCVPSSVCACHCLTGPHPPVSSVSVFVLKTDSKFLLSSNIYVSGNLLVFYERGDRRKHVSPDVFVVRGVPKKPLRDHYLIWREGKAPEFVIEVTSKSTRGEDQKKKPILYRDVLKVAEYFLFEPTEDYLKPPFQGFRLVKGQYVPIEPVLGRLPSTVLGLHLERSGVDLRLFDPTTSRWLPTPRERAEAERERAEAERERAEAERKRAEAEHERAEREKAERTRIESEAIRLREENESLRRRLGKRS